MILRKSIDRNSCRSILGIGLVLTFSPTAMAGGHHQKGQLIAVPATGVATQPAQMSYVLPPLMSYVQPVQMSYVQPPQMSYVQPVQMSYVQPPQMSYVQPVQMSYAQPQAAPLQQAVPTVHITIVEAPAPPSQPQAAPPTPQATAQTQPLASYVQPQASYAQPNAVYVQPQSSYQAVSGVNLQGAVPVHLYQVPKQHGLFNNLHKQKVLIAR